MKSILLILPLPTVAKILCAFDLLRKLSALLNTTTSNANQNLAVSTQHISDNYCTSKALQYALDGLDHGMSTVKCSKGTDTAHSISCQKLAAVTFLIDLLRMNPKHKGVKNTLAHLGHLCYESEACCSRVVILGGADLLMSLFEDSITDEDLCVVIMFVYGRLALFPSLHTSLVSSKAINMLLYPLHNFGGDHHFVCFPLSFFLCNSSIKWPEECPSHEDVSAHVIDACKTISLSSPSNRGCRSLRPHVSLLSQNVSEAAKYYSVVRLYLLIDQHPDHYCPILAREGPVTVLKQQSLAHEYVQRMAKSILKKFDEHNS